MTNHQQIPPPKKNNAPKTGNHISTKKLIIIKLRSTSNNGTSDHLNHTTALNNQSPQQHVPPTKKPKNHLPHIAKRFKEPSYFLRNYTKMQFGVKKDVFLNRI
ncbi:hypothetical protein, partial [uncultured Bacteroides sp.]|uniref:hypothetical protein n=1 Tax=uncultured Bacteroides sp. TaxID=162156 RepID=UPI00266EF0B9